MSVTLQIKGDGVLVFFISANSKVAQWHAGSVTGVNYDNYAVTVDFPCHNEDGTMKVVEETDLHYLFPTVLLSNDDPTPVSSPTGIDYSLVTSGPIDVSWSSII